ncbi:MAG: hypothetical protein IPH08_03735 [Rhodocyclaceae bacterium]|nr:hypothetical protein [Rhodocyclaceae bacterium]
MPISSVLCYDIPAAPRGGYRAFGANPAVGATAEALWAYGGAYNFVVAATTLKVASSSASDAAAGTGTKTVRVYGLVGGVETSEDATMNGTTPVSLALAFERIHEIRSLTAGTGEVNAGDIYCFTGAATAGVPDTATEVYAKMAVGAGSSHTGVFRVPTGKTGYVVNVGGFCGDVDNPVRIEFFERASGVRRSFASLQVAASGWEKGFVVPEPIPGGADVYIMATCLGAGTPEVSGWFEIVLR